MSVRTGADEDHILVTLGSRSASNYSMDAMAVVSQFFCPSFLSLTSAVAWDAASKCYVAILNSKDLLVWDGEENHIEKAVKVILLLIFE